MFCINDKEGTRGPHKFLNLAPSYLATLLHRTSVFCHTCCVYCLRMSSLTRMGNQQSLIVISAFPSLANLILIHRHPHTSLPISTPSTIHHSRLSVCLPACLDLDRCLSILFWLSACE